MPYQPVIRGKFPIKQATYPQQDFGSAFGSMAGWIAEMRMLKKELTDTLNQKINEIDAKIAEHTNKVEEVTGKAVEVVNQANKALEDTTKQAVEIIKNTPPAKGDPGKDAIPLDEIALLEKLKSHIPLAPDVEKIQADILSKIPQLDEKKLVKKFLKAIPQDKASLKIIQEKVEIDPMSVIEKIMSLPPEQFKKLKLKKENIDGLEQTMSAFQSQLGRGYLHGGGDTVSAGTNVTITTNSAGQKVISASGGGGVAIETPTGTVDGSNVTFTVTVAPVYIVSDGTTYFANQGYTIAGLTLTLSVPPTNFIRSFHA